jgi:hypothetical protein
MRFWLTLACTTLVVASAAADDLTWAAPGNAYCLRYPGTEWLVVPPRSGSDPTVLRLAPRNFDPDDPHLCSARHYQLAGEQGWEATFPDVSRRIAASITEQSAAQMFGADVGHVERVDHADVDGRAVTDVYMSGVPINGISFNTHVRSFAIRGPTGPILVELDCRAKEAFDSQVFQGLDSILRSLSIPDQG